MPRLTYAPSGRSCAARHAICRRDKGLGALSLMASPYHDDAVDEDGRRDDDFRIERTKLDDLGNLNHRQRRRHRHHRIEVPRRLAIDEIAATIGLARADQRDIAAD